MNDRRRMLQYIIYNKNIPKYLIKGTGIKYYMNKKKESVF